MAWKNEVLITTLVAAGTIAAKRFVTPIGAADNGILVGSAAATSRIIGVTMDNKVSYASGDQVPVAVCGVVKVEAGAAITLGDRLTTDGTGRAIAAVTTNEGGAIALEAAAAAGVMISALLTPGAYQK